LPLLVITFEVTQPLLEMQLAKGGVSPRSSLKVRIVKLVTLIVEHRYFRKLRDARMSGEVEGLAEEFADTLGGLPELALATGQGIRSARQTQLKLGGCFRAYCRKSRLHTLLAGETALSKASKEAIGKTRVDYLLDVVRQYSSSPKGPAGARGGGGGGSGGSGRGGGDGAPFSESDTTQLVQQLTGIFADVSDDFAHACLRHFKYKFEPAVSSILEGTLPPHLASISDRLGYVEPRGRPGEEEVDPSVWQGPDVAPPPKQNSRAKGKGILESDPKTAQFQSFMERTGRVLKGAEDPYAKGAAIIQPDQETKQFLRAAIVK
jgi:hypothetical protein